MPRRQFYRGSCYAEHMLLLGNEHDWCPHKAPVLQCVQYWEQQEESEFGMQLQHYDLIGIKKTWQAGTVGVGSYLLSETAVGM